MKTVDDYFADWESTAFGFGYGSGEPYVIPALRTFLSLCPEEGNYDHRTLEDALTPTVAWLLINVLCKADIIEYGTSPRFGWLTFKGRRLRAYVLTRDAAALTEIACRGHDYVVCYPDACNCGEDGYEADRVCANPFWRDPVPANTAATADWTASGPLDRRPVRSI